MERRSAHQKAAAGFHDGRRTDASCCIEPTAPSDWITVRYRRPTWRHAGRSPAAWREAADRPAADPRAASSRRPRAPEDPDVPLERPRDLDAHEVVRIVEAPPSIMRGG